MPPDPPRAEHGPLVVTSWKILDPPLSLVFNNVLNSTSSCVAQPSVELENLHDFQIHKQIRGQCYLGSVQDQFHINRLMALYDRTT